MELEKYKIDEYNHQQTDKHKHQFDLAAAGISNIDGVMQKLAAFNVTTPSWALGTGGTRFGRFSGGGEPRSLEEKIQDVGIIHALNRSSNSISLHIPWDIPKNTNEIKALAARYGLRFDAVNSNTFQDQPGQKLSYKYGSLHHVDKAVRQQAVDHNIEVIKYGVELGSNALSVWLSDGSNFPGQLNFRNAFQHTLDSLQQIYAALPDDWKIWVEYKPYEPNFYSTTIGDWGQSYLLAGFHFNDSKYGDDDLTVGSINPYQLFLIFNELVEGMDARGMDHAHDLGWMIDASHNVKDPVEDLLQSVEAIKIAYAQSLLVDRAALVGAQQSNDVVMAQEILQQAYRTDVRPLVAQSRLLQGGAIYPIETYRKLQVRSNLIAERGLKTVATGL